MEKQIITYFLTSDKDITRQDILNCFSLPPTTPQREVNNIRNTAYNILELHYPDPKFVHMYFEINGKDLTIDNIKWFYVWLGRDVRMSMVLSLEFLEKQLIYFNSIMESK